MIANEWKVKDKSFHMKLLDLKGIMKGTLYASIMFLGSDLGISKTFNI